MSDDLRLRVAKALGWQKIELSDRGGYGLHYIGAQPGDAQVYQICLPDWPSDDAAAVRDILPEAIKRGLEVRMGGSAKYGGWFCMIGDLDVANAPKLAEAICKSFLAACDREAAKGAT